MKELLSIIGFAILWYPLIWELYNDRKGDDQLIPIGFGWTIASKTVDVWIRGALMFGVSGVNWLILHKPIFDSFAMTIVIHLLFFDYMVAWLLGHKDWFSYLGKKSFVDNLKFWKDQSPRTRFIIRLVLFIGASLHYFRII